MKPYVADPDFTLYLGDVRQVLANLPAGSVDCCVTSPPYWGLRDYGVDGQIGLEQTPDAYVAEMVAVFAEVRRVLTDSGSLWLNLGDSYVSDPGKGGSGTPNGRNGRGEGYARERMAQVRDGKAVHGDVLRPFAVQGLAPKNLVGIPWRVAFALQQDGWYLRSDIVWAKPNPMPESVTDRPTKAHEYVFMLSKAPWIGRDPGPIEQRLSAEDARWLALLVDAEGNICIKRTIREGDNAPLYGSQIAVGSTSRRLLERAAEIAGHGSINERKGTNAPMFYWQVSNKVAQDLLHALYPHLIVKQRQAAIAIHLESLLYHRGTQNSKRRSDSENDALESLWIRNKSCNQFGDPDLSDVPPPKYGRWGASRYFFDQEAVREPHKPSSIARGEYGHGSAFKGQFNGSPVDERHQGGKQYARLADAMNPAGRNIRTVWEIATQPYPEAHFATFPEELPRRCIAAGCPEGGTVLDPFMGSGTTALVARKLGRKAVGVELNPDYAALAARRLSQLSLLALT